MEQRRSRLVAPDATGLRARILSTGGLLTVAAMVLVVLVQLFPRQELIARLRAEKRNDELSVSYLANLLTSEPDNDELRILLAERHFALKQADRAEAVLAPMQRKALASEDTLLRLSRLNYNLLELRANAARPGSTEAGRLRAELVRGLHDRLLLEWKTPDLLFFARKATALEELGLAQRFHARIRFDADGSRAPWFEEAVRTAMWAQDYAGAAALHQRAITVTPEVERQRAHLREALRILQSGNRLDLALAVAQQHDALVGGDATLLEYLTRLALAANRADVAEGYARRLLQMTPPRPAPAAAPAPATTTGVDPARRQAAAPAWLAWLGRRIEPLLGAAQAAETAPAEPPPVDAEHPPAPSPGAANRPAEGEPRRSFDDASYTLAYQTFLANRNLADAWRVATAAVRQVPRDLVWRERLAQVCEWSGRADEALAHWRELARQAVAGNDRALQDRALQGVLRLAPGLNGDEAVLATWQDVAAMRRLTVEEVLGIVALTERLGRPEEGMRWLVESERRQPARALLEAQVDLAERMGDLPVAIDALRRLIARDGVTTLRAMRLATFHGLRGEVARGYEAMRPLAEQGAAAETDAAFWRLYGNLAWSLQIESQALHALTLTTRQDGFSAIEADRLLTLLRPRDAHAAARFAERAWQQLKLPGYAITALDIWWSERDLRELERLFGHVAAEADTTFAREAYFWMLRAQWRQARGERLAALADMSRALEIEPESVDTRSAYLFLLIEAGSKGELQRLLGTWLEEATRNPAYDAAYAAGYMELELPRRALPFWRRQAALHHDDPMWNSSYADVLDAAGQPGAAQRVRAHALALTRERLRTLGAQAVAAVPPEQLQALRLQLARLMLAMSHGDANLRTMREFLGPGGLLASPMAPRLDAAARELVLGWMLSAERHDLARLWLWRRHGRSVVTPAWIEMSMALHDSDLPAIGALMDGPEGERLPPVLRAEALQALGQPTRAQALRVAQLDLRDDDGLHEAYSEAAWRTARRVEYGLEQRRDTLRATTQTLALVLPLTEAMRLRLDAGQSRQSSGTVRETGLPALGRIAPTDRHLDATLQTRPDRLLGLDLTLGRRSAERDFTTARVAASVPVIARLTLRAELGLRQPAADSAPLAVAGRQDELRLGAELRLTQTTPVRVALRQARLALQDGHRLGQASGLEWEVGQVLRGATPDLNLRLFGQYARYRPAGGALPDWTARLTPDGSRPGSAFFVPDSFALHGVGLSAGLGARDAWTRAWRPFVDLSATTHSRFGAGWSATVGAAGRVTGSDQLLIQYSATRAGSGGDARVLGLRYVLPF